MLDRCATGVPHILEDSKLSKANLALSNLDNPNKLTRPEKIKINYLTGIVGMILGSIICCILADANLT